MKKNLLLICLIFFSSISIAGDLLIDSKRDLFSEAIELQEQKLWKLSFEKMEGIRNYPLNLLLSFNYINNNFDKLSPEQILQFTKKHPNSALSTKLVDNYLLYLAATQSWDNFIIVQPELPSNKKLKCLYFQASIATKQMGQIWPDVKKMWVTDPYIPKECDLVFEFYKKSKEITESLIWTRFRLAYKHNNNKMMLELIKSMGKKRELIAKELYRLNREPEKLSTTTLFKTGDKLALNFLVPSILKLSKLDLNKAMDLSKFYTRKGSFTKAEKITINKSFIKQILQNRIEEKLAWGDSELANIKDHYLLKMRTRYAIRDNNWSDIDKWISIMSVKEQARPKWNYWHARVLEQSNQNLKANKIYKEIAQNRSYYGFLSAQKIGADYQLNENVVFKDKALLKKLQFELFYLEELFYHQKFSLLKKEWRIFIKSQPLEIQQQLGLYAEVKGWSHLEVLATILSKSWDDLHMRFPKVEPEIFSKNAKLNNFAQTYIYAVARQESAFDSRANSHVGAKGYMQLMPATAKYVANKIGLKKYKNKEQLTNVALNVKLGSAYLASLIKRYKGNRILATAAYNAGASRVDRWNANKSASMDSWIETIPYRETRNYVKNVLTFNVIYQKLFKQKLELFNQKELSQTY